MLAPLLHASLGPNAAILLLTLGLLLIYLELNRPGLILPGALGLSLSLLSIASLLRLNLTLPGVTLVLTATALLALDLLRPSPPAVAIVATLALILGLYLLVAGPPPLHVHILTAASCGLILGAATSLLTRIARRARANKALD